MAKVRFSRILGLFAAFFATPLAAETELSFYTGLQGAPHSRVEGTDPGGAGAFSFVTAWEGDSLQPPPYWGIRATYWRNENWGYGIDFSHAKVIADPATRAAAGFSRLEFTDGLNILTANVWRRWENDSRAWTPYVGAGVGLAFPYVEVISGGGTTLEYQVTGPAVAVVAGVKYEFNERWGMFGEYKGTYSMNEASLTNGGTLSTDIVTNAINIGVSFSF